MLYYYNKRAIDSVGRVPPSHGGSQGFESLIAHHYPDVAFWLVRIFLLTENPNFALWLVRLGSTIIEDEFCDARTRCSLLRRCSSLRVPYCPPRRNATNFANKTAFAVLFALTSVSPFPKSSLKLFGFLISVLAKSNLDVPFGLVRIFLLEIKKRNRLLPVPFLFQY